MCSQCDGHPDQEKFIREFNERRQAECLDCGHLLRLHGEHGCSFERGDSDETGCALGPCGCSEPIENEPLEDAIGQDLFQATLAVSYSRYILNSTRNLVGHIYGSSPLVQSHDPAGDHAAGHAGRLSGSGRL